jgi:hypothetical protein
MVLQMILTYHMIVEADEGHIVDSTNERDCGLPGLEPAVRVHDELSLFLDLGLQGIDLSVVVFNVSSELVMSV